MVLCSLPTQAASIPKLDITEQKDQQTVCVEQRANQCLNKCQKSNDITNCAELCQKNAKNECRYAGE
jgi:hypothetical protein